MMTFDDLMNKIKKRDFLPLYLLMGEEPFFIDQLSDAFEQSVMDEVDRDFNQVVLYGKETDAAEVMITARQFPFGSNYRLVIVKEAKELKDLDKLKSYLESPTSTTILVICYKYGKLKAAQTKLFEKNGLLFASDPIKDSKLASWVQMQAAKHHFKLNVQAANIITEHIGNDLSRIDNEFLKLKIFLPENSEITPDIVEKNIGISKEYNIFELQNALGDRNIQKAFKIVLNFCHNIKENPNVKTISILYTFYYKMLAYHLAPDKSPESMTAIYGKIHPYSLEINTRAAQRYSLPEIVKNISILKSFDARSKGIDNVTSEEELLKELIYRLLH